MRIVATLLILLMALPSFGCVTRSQRQWGYTDVPATTTTTLVPLGSTVPPNVAAMQNTVTTTPPNFAQPYLNNNVAAVNMSRMTYEHNVEETDWPSMIWAGVGVLGLGLFAADRIVHWDHLARHSHWW